MKKKKAKHFFFKNVSYQGVKDSTTLNLGRLRDVKHFFPKNSYSGYPFLKLSFFPPCILHSRDPKTTMAINKRILLMRNGRVRALKSFERCFLREEIIL